MSCTNPKRRALFGAMAAMPLAAGVVPAGASVTPATGIDALVQEITRQTQAWKAERAALDAHWSELLRGARDLSGRLALIEAA